MPTLDQMISKEELNLIIEMYQNNISLREIAIRTHHGRNAIAKMLEKNNIKTTFGNHYRKYTFNYNFFEHIDNELNAYWLGFMYADGCILSKKKDGYGEQDLKIAIAQQDQELLEKFKEDIQSTYPIRFDYSKAKKNENTQVQVIQCLRSQKTVDDLKRLGCIERKSLILNFPTEEQVPRELIYHFIRGYFDGDGSFSYSITQQGYLRGYISFVGTENFIKELSKYFPNMGSVLPDLRKTNSWYLNIGGNHQVQKCYHLLYDNATRYMQRKYNKFQDFFIKYSES